MNTASRKRRREQPARENVRATAATLAIARDARWVLLAIVALVMFAYSSVRHYGFETFDDPQYVAENPHVANGLTVEGISWAMASGYAANWHPLTWVSHMLDIQLFGMNAGAHHVTNVILHIATTVLLFGVLARMTGAVWRSLFVAGLFALHPIHVESVAWISERKDVLSALFWMLTLWAYRSYVRQPRPSRYLGVVALFALGLMAKSMLVTLPFALLLLDFWPLRRMSLAGGHRTVRALVIEKIPLFALSVAASFITFIVQRRGGAVAPVIQLAFGTRLANAVISYVAYLGKSLWPSHLAIYYPYPKAFSAMLVAGSVLLLSAVSVGAILLGRRHPYLPVGWFWYLGTLVPVIGLVQVGTQAMADRYTYLPLVGVFIIIAWGVPELLSRSSRYTATMAAIAGSVLILCATASKSQVRQWESTTALWTHALQVTTDNYEAHNNLGVVLARTGKRDEAIAEFTEAIRLRPAYADAHNNLGLALATQRKLEEALPHLQEAIRLDPGHARAHANLGVVWQALGRRAEAIQEYETVLRLEPNNANVRSALAAVRRQAK